MPGLITLKGKKMKRIYKWTNGYSLTISSLCGTIAHRGEIITIASCGSDKYEKMLEIERVKITEEQKN